MSSSELYALETSILDAILDSVGDLVWLVDADDFRVCWINKATRDYCFLHKNIEELVGLQLQELMSDDYPELWGSLYQRVLQEGTVQTEYRAGLSPSWLMLRLKLIETGPGARRILVTGRDITAEKNYQLDLIQMAARYRSVIEAMIEGVVFQSANGNILEANPAAEAILGLPRSDLKQLEAASNEWSAIKEDGSPYLHEEYPAVVAARSGKAQRNVLMGIVTAAGERRWIHVNSAPVFWGQDGKPTEVVTTFHDVSEQRVLEHELRVSATAFSRSQEAMMITDRSGRIINVNRTFSNLTGYRPEEVIGRNPRILSSGCHDQEFYERMWHEVKHNNYWQGEIWNRRKNGELYPEWLSITAVCDNNGRVTNYVGAFTDLTSHKEAEQRIHKLQFYDLLTGLPNRRMLLSVLEDTLTKDRERAMFSALLFVNIDDFKLINDSYGHEIGDRLLVETARRLKAQVSTGNLVARLGADEFALILDGLHGSPADVAAQVESVSLRIQRRLNRPFNVNGSSLVVTACIGAVVSDGTDSEDKPVTAIDLIRHADIAMFQAKTAGREKTHFFNPALQARLEQRVSLLSRLRQAVPDQLLLYYQLQVDSAGQPLGAECLVRWSDPQQGMVPPDVFIPLAEDSELIIPIGRWVLEMACQQLLRWAADPARRHMTLAVNVSARQFAEDSFADEVLSVLQATGADATRLKLEVTESMLIDDLENIVQKMLRLRKTGVSFSLDDFGTGFSSLSYLKRLPLDQLKIDQSFLSGMVTNSNDAAIVRTIIALGHTLGLSVIAEGVETEEQRQFLKEAGCTQFQGYLFAPPLPVELFEQRL